MSFGLPEEVLRYIKNLPDLFPGIERIVIFGSRAMENYKKGSDVDLALFGAALTSDDLSTIRSYLEGLPTPYMYDVVHYETLEHQDLKNHKLA